MSELLLKNIEHIERRIAAACINSKRDPKDVRLLLATKTVPAERIKAAFQSGHTLIAENKIQEVKKKYEALVSVPHESHFIGHLQSNKIKYLLKYGISCIQSVDRVSLAEKLHKRLVFEDRKVEVLIQVNTSNEKSKFGVAPAEAVDLVKAVSQYPTIQIKGLMTIGLFSTETEKTRPCFQLLKQLQEEIRSLKLPGVEMKELSMGMSGDLEVAIEEGATIVRVGTAIFGERKYPDSYYWNEGK